MSEPPEPPEKRGATVHALFDAPEGGEVERMVEALLFASAEPLATAKIQERLPEGGDAAQALESLRRRYQGRGVNLVRVGAGWAFRTAPDLSWLMRREAQESRRLSRAATETLAIIAYHQPVTRAEIEEIRGVSVSRGTLDLLLELDWIKLGRRRETPGRPVTFVVTQAFLDHFGLESTRDLPGLKELRAAGLLDGTVPKGDGGLETGDETPDMFADDHDDAEDGDTEADAGESPDDRKAETGGAGGAEQDRER